jgi:uncharacterized protein (DUF58 family)
MTVAPADISFGEGLLFIFEFFLLFAWIWILISIIGDLFRDHELSGVAKAVWVFFLVFLPFLGVLLYLVVRGDGMRDRTIKAKAEAKQHLAEGEGRALGRGVRPGKVEIAHLSVRDSRACAC